MSKKKVFCYNIKLMSNILAKRFDLEEGFRINNSVIRLEQDIFSRRLPQTGWFYY